MRRRRDLRWRSWVAVAAAYLVVLQVALSGQAIGAMAATVSQPGFAAMLCTHAGAEPATPGSPVPAGQPDCCDLGCPMTGGLAILPEPTPMTDAARVAYCVGQVAPSGRIGAVRAACAPPQSRAPPKA